MNPKNPIQFRLKFIVATAAFCAIGTTGFATNLKEKPSAEAWEDIKIFYQVEEEDGAKKTAVYKLNDKTMAALHESKSTDVDLMSDHHKH